MNSPARTTKAESAGLKKIKVPLRIQINSEGGSRISDRKADTCRSAATPVIPGLKSCMSKNNNHARNISDYFNSRQINDAIASADTFADRLKVVDFILKRRMEVKNAENQVKLERAAPILKNFRQNLKLKLNNGKNFNKFRVAVKDVDGQDQRADIGSKIIESSILSNEDSYNTLTKLSGHHKLKKQKTKSIEPRRRLPSIELTAAQENAPVENKIIKPVAPTTRRLSYQADQPFTINLLEAGNPFLTHREGSLVGFVQDNKRESIQHIFSKNQIIEKFADLMSGKSKTESKTVPKTKNVIKPIPVKKVVSKSVQDEANKKLEQDLYNYLSRYGPQERKLIQGMDSGSSVKIKIIEAKALAKFKTTKDSSSPGVNSHRIWTKTASEFMNVKQSGRKRVTLQLPDGEEEIGSAR